MGIEHIGFIGLGKMGRPMAARLYEAGYRLTVADAAPDVAEGFVTDRPKAVTAHTVDAYRAVDALILMLPNSAVVESVLEGDAVAEVLRPGTLVVDMSSSEPLRTRALAQRLAARGLRMLDAPVSGGVRGAVAGTLAVLVGGEEIDLAEVRPALQRLARTVIPVGPVGAGHAAKALNNLVSATTISVTVEALRLGERFGIPPETMTEVLNSSSGRSNTSENKAAQFMISGSYDSGFALQLMAKDVGIAVDLARELGQATEVADGVARQWRRVAGEVTPQTDHTAMYELIGGDR
ncbi:NAD(P)-dependent oxidoreductase [Micromonospora sp. NPDC007230]|uniref:NAD(P)-dependent oxidoreductase n=1 Tax=Micromonospora sp. NPDC007230 TaxID=3364237 RepID=UPI0036B11A4B